MEKVSVIVTIKNNPHFLEESLKSVFNSTYKNVETLVINGSETGIMPENLEDLEEEFRYIEKLGINSAEIKNTGIRESTGTMITFLDSNDINGKMRIELENRKLEEKPHLGAVFCGVTYINENGEFQKGVGRIQDFDKDSFAGKMFERNMIESISTVLFRKDVFKKVGLFDDKLNFLEDYDMYLRVLSHFKVDYLDLPLIRKRIFKEKESFDINLLQEEEGMIIKKHDIKKILDKIINVYANEDDLRISIGNILLKLGFKEVALENIEKVLFKESFNKNFRKIRKKVMDELQINQIRTIPEISQIYNSAMNK